MRKMKLPKTVGNLLDSHLEIFSPPQGIENSRHFLLLRTDSFQKTVVGFSTITSFSGHVLSLYDAGEAISLRNISKGLFTTMRQQLY